MTRLRVLLTGAAGRIGPTLVGPFRECYDLRTFDALPVPDSPDAVTGDIGDMDALQTAMTNIDVVVHLAAVSTEADFPDKLLPANIAGVYNVLEAAHQAGVRRVVFASTGQTVSAYPPDVMGIEPDAPPRPGSMYGATKVFGEALGRFYHDKRGLEFVSIRIGAFERYEDLERFRTRPILRSLWLSPRDTVRLLTCAVERENVGYAVVFGTSITEKERLSRRSARELLGFEPLDDIADLPL